ncbi:MAG TPA: hypothetical protein PKO06_11370, partial [Candidatus Ozemobacteraceae bacterium]|nr:hypothetical protein [Candidatus Ozemobacteraceae bacterium]
FLKGHYHEAHAHFLRFLQEWPAHALGAKALYFQALSACRFEPLETVQRLRDQAASLTVTLDALKDKIPEPDLVEMRVTLAGWKMQLGEHTASDPSFLALPPQTLDHWLRRGWFPPKPMNPVELLDWSNRWRTGAKTISDPLLRARLALLDAKQLWKIWCAPLPKRALTNKLKAWGYFPLEQGLSQMLQQALHHGDPETKRQAALIGLSFDQQRHGPRFSLESSPWFAYLKQRGIHEAEAWLPE